MKITQILFKQHIGRQTRRNWYGQGKVVLYDTGSEKNLAARGFDVVDPQDVVKPAVKSQLLKIESIFQKPPPLDKTHPDWKDRPCLSFNDNELLIKGLPQAQLITKTVVIDNALPKTLETSTQDVTQNIHEIVKRIIKSSCIFDAQQEKLPKRKDPVRYFYNFPRDYGITDNRKIYNLSKKLLNLVDCLSGPKISNSRSLLDNALLCLFIENEFDLYRFLLTMDVMVMSNNPLKSDKNINHNGFILPSLQPMHHSIGISKENIYNVKDLYPIITGYHKNHLHTIFVYNDPTKVKNITELEVRETQIFGRALLKAFTAAATSAKQRYGSEIGDLPEPITVQCIQTDGKAFYFSVYQLNTLNLEGEAGIKNYCWTLPKINLYETAAYIDGIPTLEGYNPVVFERLLAFYKNN